MQGAVWLLYIHSVLPRQRVAVVRVVDKRHVHPHQRGSICSQHLTPDERCQTGRGQRRTEGGEQVAVTSCGHHSLALINRAAAPSSNLPVGSLRFSCITPQLQTLSRAPAVCVSSRQSCKPSMTTWRNMRLRAMCARAVRFCYNRYTQNDNVQIMSAVPACL